MASNVKYKLDIGKAGDGYDEKYLLLCVKSEAETKWVVVSRPLEFHSDILREWEQSQVPSDDVDVEVHGGGILVIENNVPKCYGKSGGYGAVLRVDIVKRCLESKYEKVGKVEATNYIRG